MRQKVCSSYKIMYELQFLMMLKGTCMQTFSLSLLVTALSTNTRVSPGCYSN